MGYLPSLKCDTSTLIWGSAGLSLFALGWAAGRYACMHQTTHMSRLKRNDSSESLSSVATSGPGEDEGKPYVAIVVRSDIKSGKGKTATRCCHAFKGLIKKLQSGDPNSLARLRDWEEHGGMIVALSCNSEDELMAVKRAAKAQAVKANVTIDTVRSSAGVGHPKAAMAIGPAPGSVMKNITTHLTRLK